MWTDFSMSLESFQSLNFHSIGALIFVIMNDDMRFRQNLR